MRLISPLQVHFVLLNALLTLNAFLTTEGRDLNETSSVSCLHDHYYDLMNISDVLGTWKVLEIYMHLSREGVIVINKCPVVKIWEYFEVGMIADKYWYLLMQRRANVKPVLRALGICKRNS